MKEFYSVKDKKAFLEWIPGEEKGLGQWIPKEIKWEHNEILLTEEDLHYFPSQKDLDTYEYFAPKELKSKFDSSLYRKLTMKKDKVIKSEEKLNFI